MKVKNRTLQNFGLIVVAFAAVGFSPSTQAASLTWGGATNGTWNTTTNWTPNQAPTTADALTILGPANAAGALTINVDSASAVGSLNITDTAAVVLSNTTSGSNQTLSLGGAVTGLTTGAGAVTIGSAVANQAVNIALGASQTWNIGAGGMTVNNPIGGSTFGLTKTGSGLLTLTGANTFTGTTTINLGTLNLGGGTASGSINSTIILALGGGSLSYTRTGSTTQTFASTSVNAGTSAVITVAGDTLALGAITQAVGGTVDFGTTGTTTTSTANVSGILGGWATINNTGVGNTNGDWVANNGSGTIITYAGYTSVTGVATTGTGPAAQNWKTTNTTSIAANTTINSLNMQNDFSVASGATLTINSGGLMMRGVQRWLTNNGAGTITGTGKITSGLASGELFVHVPKSDAIDWSIWPTITDNGVTLNQLIKDGPGLVYLRNQNTYTGGTIVNGGTLRLEHTAADTDGIGVIRGTLTINAAGTVIGAGTANSLGYTATKYVNVMNVNGGLFSSIVVGDQGYAITYNLKGGTIQSNSGTSSNSTT